VEVKVLSEAHNAMGEGLVDEFVEVEDVDEVRDSSKIKMKRSRGNAKTIPWKVMNPILQMICNHWVMMISLGI